MNLLIPIDFGASYKQTIFKKYTNLFKKNLTERKNQNAHKIIEDWLRKIKIYKIEKT